MCYIGRGVKQAARVSDSITFCNYDCKVQGAETGQAIAQWVLNF